MEMASYPVRAMRPWALRACCRYARRGDLVARHLAAQLLLQEAMVRRCGPYRAHYSRDAACDAYAVYPWWSSEACIG